MWIALTGLLIVSATPTPISIRKVTAQIRGGRLEIGLDAPAGLSITPRTYGDRRLYLELEPAAAAKEALGAIEVGGVESIEALKVAQFDADTVRVIADFRIERPPVTEVEIGDRRVSIPIPSAKEPERSGILSEIVEQIREAYPDVEIAAESPEVTEPKSPRSEKAQRGRSIVAIRKVVIDAGHGGRDRGAVGAGGVLEKNINLEIAQRLGRELEKKGIRVVYTRTADKYVSLSRRTQIANRSEADLFISIHANANRSRRVSGVETYYLNTSSSRYSQKIARRENGAGPEVDLPDDDPMEQEDEERELPEGALGRDLRLMFADLAMRSATTESKRLAGYVQSSLVRSLEKEHGDVRDLGVKHALFYVLVGVRMPSVLIETGFLTNPAEGKRLASSEYQRSVASAIAGGVRRFVTEREEMAAREDLAGHGLAAN